MLKLTTAELRNLPADTLAVSVCEDTPIHDRGPVATLIRQADRYEEFSGKSGDRIVLYDPPRSGLDRVLFFGLGPAAELTPESFRRMAGRAVKAAIDRKRKALCIAFPSARKVGMSAEVLAAAIMEGACLANHVYDRFRSDSKKSPLDTIYLRVTKAEAKRFSSLAKTVQTVCESTCLAREWVSDPSNRP